MSKEMNIILTSINPYIHVNPSLKFYYYEDDNGECQYCTGISDQEAGTKYLMSSNKIDGIIVVGSKQSAKEEYHLKGIDLKTTAEFYSSNLNDKDAYSQFVCRLAQFINGVDTDSYEVYELLSEKEREEAGEIYEMLAEKTFATHDDKDKSKLFHYIRLDESSFNSTIYPLIEDRSAYMITGALCHAYNLLNDHYKMKSLLCNDKVNMWFAPINKGVSDNSSITNLLYVFDWILNNNVDTKLNIYLDTQGLNQNDSFALFQIVLMLSTQNNRIYLKDYITSNPYYNYTIRKINHSLKPAYLNELSTGINDFINYGKADLIVNYWERYPDIDDKYIEDFVYAMKKIDIGISLCNYAELEMGIKKIKKLIAKEYKPEDGDFEKGLFKILTHGIISDYGPLLSEGGENEVDTFELIKWAYRKKYYQQAITFIESQIPDDIVKKGIWYYAQSEEELDNLTKYIASEYVECSPNLRYSFNDLNHYMIKNEGRNRPSVSSVKSNRDSAFAEYKVSLLNPDLHLEENYPYKAYTSNSDESLVKKVLLQYYVVSKNRNSINHASRHENDNSLFEGSTESIIWDQVKSIIENFLTVYQQAVDDLGNKTGNIYRLDYNEMINLSYKLKKNNRNGGKRKPSRYSILCPDGYEAHCEDILSWLNKYPHKHPELMEEPAEKVVEELMKTRDEYVNSQKTVDYKGYRLLPTEYDKPIVKKEETINKTES